jgi:hypothetical protein
MASLKVGFSVTKVAQSNFPPVTPDLELQPRTNKYKQF